MRTIVRSTFKFYTVNVRIFQEANQLMGFPGGMEMHKSSKNEKCRVGSVEYVVLTCERDLTICEIPSISCDDDSFVQNQPKLDHSESSQFYPGRFMPERCCLEVDVDWKHS